MLPALSIAVVLLGGAAIATVPASPSMAGTPNLKVEPASAAPGDRITVIGEFFPGQTQVELRWSEGSPPVHSERTTPHGSFRAQLVVPDLPPGPHALTATSVGSSQTPSVAPISATVTLSVTGAAAAAPREAGPIGDPSATPTPVPSAADTPSGATPAPEQLTPAPGTPPPPAPVTPPPPPPPPPVVEVPGFRMVITIYNNAGANVALGQMRPYLRSGDIFLVLSGNNGNALNVAWVNEVAARLVAGVPGTTVYAATAGVTNGATLAAGVRSPVSGIAYVYEPNMANEPEFSWDWVTTQTHFRTFANAAHARGLLAVGKPTGRPLLEGSKLPYGWSYGTLGTIMDVQTPQFQTWCRQGLYPQALDKAMAQYNAAGRPHRFYPEISLDLGSINGVQPQVAIACSRAAVQRGLPGALVWWSPALPAQAITYLSAFRNP
jgi:hypothetical protein